MKFKIASKELFEKVGNTVYYRGLANLVSNCESQLENAYILDVTTNFLEKSKEINFMSLNEKEIVSHIVDLARSFLLKKLQ